MGNRSLHRLKVLLAASCLVLFSLAGLWARRFVTLWVANELIVDLVDTNDIEGMHWAVKAGANLDARRGEDDGSLLHIAAARGYREIVTELIAAGATVNARNRDGHTPLHLCAIYCRPEVAKILIENGADIEAVDNYSEDTPLHWAARKSCQEVLQQLLVAGADKDGRNTYGDTPLLLGAGNSGVTHLLVASGADLSARNCSGQTLLHRCSSDMVPFLIAHGIAVDTKTQNGETPLHFCARAGNICKLEVLVHEGANVNSKRSDGSTPLHLAAETGQWDCVRFLLASGADPTIKDERSRTATDRALNEQTKELLKRHCP